MGEGDCQSKGESEPTQIWSWDDNIDDIDDIDDIDTGGKKNLLRQPRSDHYCDGVDAADDWGDKKNPDRIIVMIILVPLVI